MFSKYPGPIWELFKLELAEKTFALIESKAPRSCLKLLALRRQMFLEPHKKFRLQKGIYLSQVNYLLIGSDLFIPHCAFLVRSLFPTARVHLAASIANAVDAAAWLHTYKEQRFAEELCLSLLRDIYNDYLWGNKYENYTFD